MDKRPSKGPICGVENCRSRSYEEGEDGFLYCQNGHRQHGLIRGDDDEDNFTTATRTVTRKRKEVDENERRVAKHFSGRQAFDLYLKCVQLILRYQLQFLIQERGLPAELEHVTFDLWALRIAQLSDRIASSNDENESQSQSQVFSTLDTEDSDATDNQRGLLKRIKGKDQKLAAIPNLKDCLALCYLGILTLRLPITPGDIYAWVTDGKMAYIRAIKYLPLAMRDRLPPEYHAVLDPNMLLNYKRFYSTVMDLQISYEKDHGIQWPALNVPILLFRYLKDLALPLELYDATTRLGALLGYDFALHQGQTKRLGIRHLPEAQLIGCLVVCIKLLYPFEDEQRYPKASSEPTTITFDWKEWCKQMEAAKIRKQGDTQRFTTEELMMLREEDVLSMLSHQVDQYLNFYADTFLDDVEIQRTKDNDDFRNALYTMFPIEGPNRHPPIQISDGLSYKERLEVVKSVHNSMNAVMPVSDVNSMDNILRPGQLYPSWKKVEELSEQVNSFFEEASRLVGLTTDMLLMAVVATEARVEQWRRKQAREQRARGSQGFD